MAGGDAFCHHGDADFFWLVPYSRVHFNFEPWTWLGALFAASYAVSFFPLRKHSKAIAKSFAGPVITLPALWAWILFCELLFDPFP